MTSKPTISAAEITKALDFRHACKKFDADKKITDEDMTLILEAIRLTPTSYGFEQFDIIVAQDQQLRQDLKKCAPINKPRFDASHFLIFTAKTAEALSDHIDHILQDVKEMNLVERTAYKTFWKQWAKNDFKLMDTPDGLHQWQRTRRTSPSALRCWWRRSGGLTRVRLRDFRLIVRPRCSQLTSSLIQPKTYRFSC